MEENQQPSEIDKLFPIPEELMQHKPSLLPKKILIGYLWIQWFILFMISLSAQVYRQEPLRTILDLIGAFSWIAFLVAAIQSAIFYWNYKKSKQ